MWPNIGWSHFGHSSRTSDVSGYTPPVMMFAHGCSMSTVAINLMKDILDKHSMKAVNFGRGEMLKGLQRSQTASELIADLPSLKERPDLAGQLANASSLVWRFNIVHNKSQEEGFTLLFKNDIEMVTKKNVMQLIHDKGTRAILLRRRNVIDIMACEVRDFCDKKWVWFGHMVDSRGNQSDCGFRGRGELEQESTSSGILDAKPEAAAAARFVWLDPKKVVNGLVKKEENNDEARDYLLGNHKLSVGAWPYHEFAAEDLLAFEYGDADGFRTSVTAWAEVLSSIGVKPDKGLIEEGLKSWGKFPEPKTHSQTILNFWEVAQALDGTKFGSMLRV